MKPGPEKEFDQTLVVMVNSKMKEFLAKEAERVYPNAKRGAISRIVRQALINYWVSVEQEMKNG